MPLRLRQFAKAKLAEEAFSILHTICGLFSFVKICTVAALFSILCSEDDFEWMRFVQKTILLFSK